MYYDYLQPLGQEVITFLLAKELQKLFLLLQRSLPYSIIIGMLVTFGGNYDKWSQVSRKSMNMPLYGECSPT